jgi:hypothetical protein
MLRCSRGYASLKNGTDIRILQGYLRSSIPRFLHSHAISAGENLLRSTSGELLGLFVKEAYKAAF